MNHPAGNIYYEYKIKNGDTFSDIMYTMFGKHYNNPGYAETKNSILALNPQITDPNRIKAGDMLRLGIMPTALKLQTQTAQTISHRLSNQVPQQITSKPTFITESVPAHNIPEFWALSWLEHNTNYLTIPGSIAMGAAGNLSSPGNVNLINQISDHYANYKTDAITKGQYDYRRKKALDELKKNIGSIEKILFGENTTHESIRIARGGGIPATAHITKHADRIKTMASISKNGGYVLMGVGLTTACMQIASADDVKEKNLIFVDTIVSTAAGAGLGWGISLFLISNPIGWGTALVLAVGSTALSYGSGKLARLLYDAFGEVDLVTGIGVDRICK